MGMLDKVVNGALPPELMKHLEKLDTFADMAADIKAIRGLLERQEQRELGGARPRKAG